MTTLSRFIGRRRPDADILALAGLLILAELLFAVAYVSVTRARITSPVMVTLVPLVWLNLSLWVFLRVRPTTSSVRRWPAFLVALGYFTLLAVFGGLLIAGDVGGIAELRVHITGFPGWVPLIIVDAGLATFVVVPFKLVGYLALSYLVYVTAVDAAGALLGGAVGLFSCISCTFPLIAALLTSFSGGGAAVATIYSNSYLLSTLVFAVTVGLLVWRPTMGNLTRIRTLLAR